MRHYTEAVVKSIASENDMADGVKREAAIRLRKGDSAYDPSRFPGRIYGPCIVHYTFWTDGGVDVRVVRGY